MAVDGSKAPRDRPYEAVLGLVALADPVDAIAQRMRTAIAFGLLADGELLPSEAVLAAQLGVTVFSLREALAELRSDGLIETKRGRNGGSAVRRRPVLGAGTIEDQLRALSSAELREIGDWRQMLSGAEAYHAAGRASVRNVRRLRDYVARVESAKDAAEGVAAYGRVHLELAAAAQSVRFSTAEVEFLSTFGWIFCVLLNTPEERKEVADRYRHVVNAIERRDQTRARALAERHAASLPLRALELRMTALRGQR
jgi:GntR family transcriptional repressor for pyruvate dehydrogenase complex